MPRVVVALVATLVALPAAELVVRAWLAARGEAYDAGRAAAWIQGTIEHVTGSLGGIPVDGVPEDGVSEDGVSEDEAEGEVETLPPSAAVVEDDAVAPEDAEVLDPAEPSGAEEPRPRRSRYLLHPFAGYEPGGGSALTEEAVAFFASDAPERTFSVFYMGGSVAAGFATGGGKVFESALARSPLVEGRDVRRFTFAVPGYRQPQQLGMLAYLFARGCRPDLVINLDGLNEVRIAPQNAVHGVPVSFPSYGHWAVIQGAVAEDPEAVDALVDVRMLQRAVREVGETALRRHYASSALLGRWTLSRLSRLQAQWAAAQERHVEALSSKRKAGARSARERAKGVEPSVEEAVSCWHDASLAMHDLCAARGVRYLHVLQPTLHDEGSKPVTAEERRVGIGDEGLDRAVLHGYPLLRAGMRDLAERGVETLDLSLTFAQDERTLYVDSCHFGLAGYQALAQAIAAHLGAEVRLPRRKK